MARTPREVIELVRQMVAGEGNIAFADLFAPNGVLRYPFAYVGVGSDAPEKNGLQVIDVSDPRGFNGGPYCASIAGVKSASDVRRRHQRQ